MIVTLTPNPSVDRTVFLDALMRGSVNRSVRSWSEPSGKGVNVALALHAHGYRCGPCCRSAVRSALSFVRCSKHAGLDTVVVPIAGEIRSNISLTQADGTVTKINESGPCLERRRRPTALIDAVDRQSRRRGLAGVRGKLCPPACRSIWYAQLVELGHRRQVNVVVDSSGPPLAASLPAGPDLIKPNEHELAELVGGDLDTLGDVIDAAEDIRRRGVRSGAGQPRSRRRDPASMRPGPSTAEAPVTRVVSTVGAGDALLAGYLSTGSTREHRLATALQWGAAAVQHEGTLFTPVDAPVDVSIHESVDRARRLHNHEPAPTIAGPDREQQPDSAPARTRSHN